MMTSRGSLALALFVVLAVSFASAAPMPVYIAWQIESLFNLDITGATYSSKFQASIAFQPNAAVSAIPSVSPSINYLELHLLPTWIVLEPLNSIKLDVLVDIARWSETTPTFVPRNASTNASAPWIIRQLRWITVNSDVAALRVFPFDSHICTTSVAIKYPNLTSAVFVVVPQTSAPGYLDDAWEVINSTAFLDTYLDPLSGERYSAVTSQVGIARRSAYYRGKIVTVMCVLVCMGWLLFFLDMTDASRVLATSTIFLVLVTFNLSTQDNLPRVSYLTRLDSFTLLCLVNTFFVFIIFNFQYLMESLLAQRKSKIEEFNAGQEKAEAARVAASAATPAGSTEPMAEAAVDQTAAIKIAQQRQQWQALGPFRGSTRRAEDVAEHAASVIERSAAAPPASRVSIAVAGTPDSPPALQMTNWMLFWMSHRHRINLFFFVIVIVPFVAIAPIIVYAS